MKEKKIKSNIGLNILTKWMGKHQKKAFRFQLQTWQAIAQGKSGLVNAPTGFGKTYSVFFGVLIHFIDQHPETYRIQTKNGLQLLWITPLRALAKDIGRAMEEVLTELEIPWKVSIRNGDTPVSERQKQKNNMPEILIITPESLHLLFAQKNNSSLFEKLFCIAIDEWHELMGSKRGVQTELAISHLVQLKEISKHPKPLLWGISATIGNLDQAMQVLTWPLGEDKNCMIITADLHKKIELESIIPDPIEKYPWAGHLGLHLAEFILPVLDTHKTTLIFINTRGMSERWYQHLLNISPGLAGAIALHHGSIEPEMRMWVEDALHSGTLSAVVCTASLDLGVDFRPVEMVVQVGSPKGVARFLQRAGRSGHQPGETSKILFLPTHSLELLEAAALSEAMATQFIESREPLQLCYDVLIQFLGTLAVGEGFYKQQIFKEITATHCFASLPYDSFLQVLHFITQGGKALQQYDDFKKVEVLDGLYKINNRRIAMRHRLHIGTIVSDAMLKVKLISGTYIGVIEEWFISRLNPGDVFTLAGRNLEFIRIKDMTVQVRKSNANKSIVPSWNGGRMPLSANLGFMLRKKLNDAAEKKYTKKDKELTALEPLFETQKKLSHLPLQDELLIEHIYTKDGYHLFVYPFEGRLVHEAMAALLAFRLSQITPISFSIAMNDYGFELLSDQAIPLDDTNVYELFSEENLLNDIQRSVNASEMARRKFRDIAVIGGLVFKGMPGEHIKQKHLQSSASLLFNVFQEYDPGNLLLRQAYNEVMEQQMDEPRLRNMLKRIQQGKIIIRYPGQLTPFCFLIKVDSMREHISSEKLEDRILKMQMQLSK